MARSKVNIPHPPQKVNILGRKRYSGSAAVTDVINYSFDDCWRAIGWLWTAIILLAAMLCQLISKGTE